MNHSNLGRGRTRAATWLWLAVCCWCGASFAANPAGEEATTEKQPAPAKKTPGLAGKLEQQLNKYFKTWNRNKDDALDLAEMEKPFARLKPKAKKNQPVGPNPLEAVKELHGAIDADDDEQVTQEEFQSWSTEFSAYLSSAVELLNRRAELEAELAKTQALVNPRGAVTALDGIADSELRRGVLMYESMLKDNDQRLKELDPDEKHVPYRDFVWQHLLKGKAK